MSLGLGKRTFASGLVVLLPVLCSLYILAYLYALLAAAPFMTAITAETLSGIGVPAAQPVVTFARVVTVLAVSIMVIFSVGFLMRTALGDLFERTIDGVMNRIPGLRMVYNASKMAVETAVTGTDDLQTPVKVQVWNGMMMTAFKTGKTTADGRDVIFLPTAPNITTGFVLEVDSADYEELDERTETSLTRILSAGFGDSRPETEIRTVDPVAEATSD